MKGQVRWRAIGCLVLLTILGFVIINPTIEDWTRGLQSDFIVYGQTGGAATQLIYLPQIADGGGYSTTFTILNTTASAVTGTLRLYNDDGTGKTLLINDVTASQFTVSVPANGSIRLTTPNAGSTVKVGWASFESATKLPVVATFDYRQNGVLQTTVGVLGTAGSSRVVLPIDFSSPTASTGIAVANVQTSAVSVRLRLYGETGNEIQDVFDSRLNPLGPQQHVAAFVDSFFPNLGSSFKGSLAVEVVGSGTIAVTGLNLKEGLFSTVPVIDAVSTSTTVAPTVSSIFPSFGNAGSTVTVTIGGNNFVSGGTNVAVSGTGVTVGSIQINGTTLLTTTFSIASTASTGSRTVTVTTSGGTSNGQTFTINPQSAPLPTLSSINPSSGTVGTSVTVTVTGTNFGNGTSLSVSGTGVTVGSIQVVGTTSVSATLAISSTAAPGGRTVTVTTSAGNSNGLTFTVNAASSGCNNTSCLQAQRLSGTWVFSYKIGTSPYTDTYHLNSLQPSSSTPGDWFIYGTGTYGQPVIADYDVPSSLFGLYDPGSIIDQFYTFTFTGQDSVSGCYYLITPPGSTNLSACYPMTGTRTSNSAISTTGRISTGYASRDALAREKMNSLRSDQPDDKALAGPRTLVEKYIRNFADLRKRTSNRSPKR